MKFREPNAKEEKLKLKAAAALEADRVRLLMDQPFVGSFLIRQNLVPIVDCRCTTACTDGQNIFVNPEFYFSLSPAERRFLLAHEVWHTIYLHFQRRKDRDEDLFNLATDMEVNRMLKKEGFKAPEGALLPPKEWDDLNAESIYEKLQEKAVPVKQHPFDVHLDSGSGGQNPSDESTSSGGEDEEGCPVLDPDYQVDFGSDPEERVREKIVESATQYKKRIGTLPDHLSQIVEDFQAGKLRWQELLAQFVTSCFGGSRRWLPPNRRYISSGLYLQSRRDSRLQAVLAFDTSGSTGEELPQFAAEFTNLLNTFGQYDLTVICCDSQIQSVETYSQDKPFPGRKFNFKGGGGTAFTPVFDYIKKNIPEVNLLVYFTDGYGDIPAKPSYPVMWVISPNGKNVIPWGYEINLT